MKQTLKITISPTKPKILPINLNQKKMPHPPFHMEKEGGPCRSLRTTIKEDITMTNLTKQKKTPAHPLHLRGWVNY